jgi:hypothetical protein
MGIYTHIHLGREATNNELHQQDKKIAELEAAGIPVGVKTPIGDVPYHNQREWQTLDAANNWITFVNDTFTPGPLSAEIVQN